MLVQDLVQVLVQAVALAEVLAVVLAVVLAMVLAMVLEHHRQLGKLDLRRSYRNHSKLHLARYLQFRLVEFLILHLQTHSKLHRYFRRFCRYYQRITSQSIDSRSHRSLGLLVLRKLLTKSHR